MTQIWWYNQKRCELLHYRVAIIQSTNTPQVRESVSVGGCVCGVTHLNSSCTAYSLDIKGISSSAKPLANFSALSQSNRFLLICKYTQAEIICITGVKHLKKKFYYARTHTHRQTNTPNHSPPVQQLDSLRTYTGPGLCCSLLET